MSPRCIVCAGPRSEGRATCAACRRGVGRTRGACRTCAKPDRLLDRAGRCRWCRERAEKRCADCAVGDTALISIDGVRVCDRCALRRDVNRVLPADSTSALLPLRDAILPAESLTTRRWLLRTRDLLQALHNGHIPLDHAALDALPHPKAVEHLRALLVATAILPPDTGRDLRRLEAALPNLVRDLTEDHRRLTTSWVRWTVLPHLRNLTEHGRELTVPTRNSYRKIEQAVLFLTGLQQDGRRLGQCTQYDIDSWFAPAGAIRWVLRPFLTWAHRNRHLPAPLVLPRSYKGKPTAAVDSEQRWDIARRLVHDDNLDPVDRVAGALVVLYAQPLARVITLTTADVTATANAVHLQLGADPLELPEPFATLITQLPHKRRASTAEQLPNPWLFAGSHAGQHLTHISLARRLNAIGIQPQRMRLAAADQLSREIPPAMLAGVLGLKPASVARATTQTSGQWANYAADRRP